MQLKQDNVFGTQILTNWNGYQLLGIRNKPAGTDFDISLDYLSKRGFGYGGSFTYDREDMFGIPGHVAGLADFWGIQDQGVDDLGQGRIGRPARSSPTAIASSGSTAKCSPTISNSARNSAGSATGTSSRNTTRASGTN